MAQQQVLFEPEPTSSGAPAGEPEPPNTAPADRVRGPRSGWMWILVAVGALVAAMGVLLVTGGGPSRATSEHRGGAKRSALSGERFAASAITGTTAPTSRTAVTPTVDPRPPTEAPPQSQPSDGADAARATEVMGETLARCGYTVSGLAADTLLDNGRWLVEGTVVHSGFTDLVRYEVSPSARDLVAVDQLGAELLGCQ